MGSRTQALRIASHPLDETRKSVVHPTAPLGRRSRGKRSHSRRSAAAPRFPSHTPRGFRIMATQRAASTQERDR